MVVLGFLSTAGIVLRTYIPQSAEMLSIIAGDSGVPAYQIQVLPGGTEIEFRGGLRAGSAKELERILGAVPRAKVLHIESPGGRLGEAEQMMQLVRQRNLSTYSSEYCLSAATLVLMAG
jgi:membrane-bound ClpP family serine protease